MKITEQTMRADGKTVGEARNEDAEFLKGMGVDVKNDEGNKEELHEVFQEKVRRVVLSALDSVSPSGKGWTDADLKNIFPAIDKHAETLFNRLYDDGARNF